MSILSKIISVKNTAINKFHEFSFSRTTEKEKKQLIDFATLDLGATIALYHGSIPNKLISLALSASAAYAVGIPPWYIGVTVVASFLTLASPRWIFELCVVSNLLLLTAYTMPEASLTTLEYLILLKLLLELFCVAFDKLTQFYAAITADQRHSYYFLWSLFTWSVALAVTNCPFIDGFIAGFKASISGM